MYVDLTPSVISGRIGAPASKSAMQRACAAALLRGGKVTLLRPGVSEDDLAAMGIIGQLGAAVTQGENVQIESDGIVAGTESIHCGESGLSVRMFTPIAALLPQIIRVDGSGSLRRRPLHFFNDVLPQLGVRVESDQGRLPLTVQGPLRPRNITIDGRLSSQFLTGLLFAYAGAGASDVTITVEGLNSKPYIDLTLQVMKDFGLKTPVNRDYHEFYYDSRPVTRATSALTYVVEGDWSGAAFLLVAGAVAGEVVVTGLDVFSAQADRAVLQPLMQAGAVMSVEEKQISIRRGPLRAFHFNATDCPDLFPPLVALAACCEGRSVIEGVHRLTHKESNRALTLQEEFGKLGIEILLQDDLMVITGGPVRSASVHSHHDHRIAMACAVAGLRANGTVRIEAAEAVGKSYPQFWAHLQQLGGQLSLSTQTSS